MEIVSQWQINWKLWAGNDLVVGGLVVHACACRDGKSTGPSLLLQKSISSPLKKKLEWRP